MKHTKETFIKLNKNGDGIWITHDNKFTIEKLHDIFINQDSSNVLIRYIINNEEKYSQSISNGWEYIKVITTKE